MLSSFTPFDSHRGTSSGGITLPLYSFFFYHSSLMNIYIPWKQSSKKRKNILTSDERKIMILFSRLELIHLQEMTTCSCVKWCCNNHKDLEERWKLFLCDVFEGLWWLIAVDANIDSNTIPHLSLLTGNKHIELTCFGVHLYDPKHQTIKYIQNEKQPEQAAWVVQVLSAAVLTRSFKSV